MHKLGQTHVDRVKKHFLEVCPHRFKLSKITDSFSIVVDKATQSDFNKKFALWFYSTGMAFEKASHVSLKNALQFLSPGCEPPTPDALGTTLLDECYNDMRDKINHDIEGKRCSIVSDAWTDVNGSSVINYVVVCGSDTYFLESNYTGAGSQSADYLSKHGVSYDKAGLYPTMWCGY